MKFSRIAAVSVLGMTTLFGGAKPGFAETDGLPSTGSSNASIQFTQGSGPVAPVDPTDPTNPLFPPGPTDPTDPPTGNTGSLTLDYVSSVQFGSNEISTTTQVYSSKSKKGFIQVSDRRGTGDGWTVTAKASKFSNGTTDTLPGSVLTFKNGEVVSTSTSQSPIPEQTITLNTDGSSISKIVSAKSGSGLGTWVTRWLGQEPEVIEGENNKITLTIPAGSATVGNHEATITWTLTDAPGI